MPLNDERTLNERLEDHLAKKRMDEQAKFDDDLRTRAQQVRTLQGMLGQVNTVNHKCSKCGHVDMVLDPRPIAADDDYDTRA